MSKTIISSIEDLQQCFGATKRIINADLSNINSITLSKYDFTGSELTNVSFSNTNDSPCNQNINGLTFKNCRLCQVTFSNAYLCKCSFQDTILSYCDFSSSSIKKSSFKRSVMNHCQFSESWLYDIDWRYAEIKNTSFEDATFILCDFYRSFFSGINIFFHAKLLLCSINFTYFENACFRKVNLELKPGKINLNLCVNDNKTIDFIDDSTQSWNKHLFPFLAEDKNAFHWFVSKDLKNDSDKPARFDPIKKTKQCYSEASNIYRHLSSIWESKGLFRDASWAYVKAKQYENKQRLCDLKNNSSNRFVLVAKWLFNGMLDLSSGYGTSISRIMASYLFIFILFGVFYATIYHNGGHNANIFPKWFIMSLKSMVGLTDTVTEKGILLEFLSHLQTTLGILLTGFLGFVVADRVRKS